MVNVKYRLQPIDNDECVQFINMQLQSGSDMTIMFSIFCQYSIKGFIKLDNTLVRFVRATSSSLIYLWIFDEILACMVDLVKK